MLGARVGEMTAVAVSSNKALGVSASLKGAKRWKNRVEWNDISTFMEMRTVGCFQGRENRCI